MRVMKKVKKNFWVTAKPEQDPYFNWKPAWIWKIVVYDFLYD
jgi:hypothetical protein